MPRSSGASGSVRASAERTRDLIPAVGAVLHELNPGQDYGRLLDRTMVRLELGIPAEICDLVIMSGATLSRTEWLAVAHAGVTSVEVIKDATVEHLASILGSEEAARTLRQACETKSSRAEESSLVLPVPTE